VGGGAVVQWCSGAVVGGEIGLLVFSWIAKANRCQEYNQNFHSKPIGRPWTRGDLAIHLENEYRSDDKGSRKQGYQAPPSP